MGEHLGLAQDGFQGGNSAFEAVAGHPGRAQFAASPASKASRSLGTLSARACTSERFSIGPPLRAAVRRDDIAADSVRLQARAFTKVTRRRRVSSRASNVTYVKRTNVHRVDLQLRMRAWVHSLARMRSARYVILGAAYAIRVNGFERTHRASRCYRFFPEPLAR